MADRMLSEFAAFAPREIPASSEPYRIFRRFLRVFFARLFLALHGPCAFAWVFIACYALAP